MQAEGSGSKRAGAEEHEKAGSGETHRNQTLTHLRSGWES